MPRPSGDLTPPQGSDPADADTVAFPLKPGAPKRDNVFTVAPGTIIAGKYRVIRTVGRGGMGFVVEAMHLQLDARVAIKFLLPEFMSYEEAAERFMREARMVAKLQTHHVARVLDVSTLDSGEPYMVMEFLEGQDLASRARELGPIPIEDALDELVQACEAMAEAHAQGIVHRDLKPANLFLTKRPDGLPFIKLLDFGVSKVLGDSEGNVSLTQTTTILGSALYMSPEQMRSSKAVDHRTDIYALGACLFEMIAGKPPYFAESFPELCAKVWTSPPAPLAKLRPGIHPALVKTIEKSLAHQPEDRHQSIAEFVHGLAPHASHDTRRLIASILRQHAPHLSLPPAIEPLEAESMPSSLARSDAHPMLVDRVSAVPVGADAQPSRRSRGPVFFLAGLAVVAVIAWGAFKSNPTWFSQSTPAADQLDTAQAETAPPLASDVPGEATAVTEVAAVSTTDATATQVALLDAGVADAAAATTSVATTIPSALTSAVPTFPAGPTQPPTAPVSPSSQVGWGLPGPAETPNATRTPPPPVNTDLGQESCTAIMPDGSKKSIPCN